jgi:LAS superfamily LD-carboxypeptidase LdcB
LVIAVALVAVSAILLRQCGRRPAPAETAPTAEAPPATPTMGERCSEGGYAEAARANRESLETLPWAPFGRLEHGWAIYAPLVGRELGTECGPGSERFAALLAGWRAAHRLPETGAFDEATFRLMKQEWHRRRPFVRTRMAGVCPEPPQDGELATARPDEGYSGKTIQLRPEALAAYRRMVEAARRELPYLRDDPRWLTIFSGYRSPESDAARCAREMNCQGIVRAACSPHRTGYAIDIYLGYAPGFPPDSSADPNRLFMSRTAAYRWLVAHADAYGFVNYPFEPWHWEWRGGPEVPGSNARRSSARPQSGPPAA